MSAPSRLLRRFFALALLAGVAGSPVAACGGGSNTVLPAAGLMVRVSTNAPALVHVVALEMYEGNTRVFRNVVPVGPGEGQVTLPAKLAVEPGQNPRGIVTIIGYVGDELHNILGKTVAETTIPDSRFAVLDMSIDVICIQTKETTGTIGTNDTDAHSRCMQGQTCRDGQCASDQVDSAALATYVGDDAGTVSTAGGCFATDVCLGGSGARVAEVDPFTCTFPAPPAGDANVGIVVAGGVPTPFGSVAVLDHGTEWTEAPAGRLQLSPPLCDLLRAGEIPAIAVVASGVSGCATKVTGVAVCGNGALDGGMTVADSGHDGTLTDSGNDARESGTCNCSSPPACHRTPGTCAGQICNYPVAEYGAPCPNGTCNANGACIDACAGVTCSTPPVCRTTAGATCTGGTCAYPSTPTDARCIGTCSGGACSDPCSGVTCTTPAVCHTATGATCGGAGVCSYPNAPDASACAGGTCQGGSCSNPCAGITCTSSMNSCKLNTGSCSGGACSYPNVMAGTGCPGGTCDGNGACVADPCAGVTCNMPGTCQSGAGTCMMGVCSYGSAPNGTMCTGGSCQGGVCTNPCTPNPCITPPTECYVSPGMCYVPDGGAACYYPPKMAGLSCSTGTCNGNGACTSLEGGLKEGGVAVEAGRAPISP